MTKTLYICGDSFCSSDPAYGDNWTDLLSKKLSSVKVVNLSLPGSSNYLIYKQVKYAINQSCDYLIYNATGSTRQEFTVSQNTASIDSIDRYFDLQNPGVKKELVCMSWVQPINHKHTFTSNENTKISQFCLEYFDLPSTIEKNYIFILHTLNLICSSKNIKNWAWSQGGFEHKKFTSSASWEFSNFKNKESTINLWDYYDSSVRSPVYHITDKQLLQTVCDQYINMLQL